MPPAVCVVLPPSLCQDWGGYSLPLTGWLVCACVCVTLAATEHIQSELVRAMYSEDGLDVLLKETDDVASQRYGCIADLDNMPLAGRVHRVTLPVCVRCAGDVAGVCAMCAPCPLPEQACVQ